MLLLINVHVTILSSLLLLYLTLEVSEGNTATTTTWAAPSSNNNNFTDTTLLLSSKSKWVQRWWKDPPGGGDPRRDGCRRRPRICNRGERPPFKMRCCRNRCVDITSDVNHCGLCMVRCPYTWQCCRGQCRNINRNPKHCGRCFNRCPFPVRCLFGMCGYGARPFPPRPPPCPFPPSKAKALNHQTHSQGTRQQ